MPPHLYAYPLLSMVETGMEKDKNQNRKQTLGIAAHADKAMECGQDRKARVQKWFAAHADKAMECGQDRKARVQKWLALDELHRVVTPPHLYAYPLLSMVETGMEKDKNQNRKQTLGIAAHADKAMECGQDRKARVQKWFAAHADKAMECGQDRKARVQKWLALDELHRVVTPPHLYAYPLLSMVETGMEKDKNQNRKQTLGIAAHADKAMECGQDRKARVQKWFAAHADKAMECGQDRKARVQKWLALDELHRVVTPPHLYAYPLLSMVETGMEKDKNQNRKQTLGIAAHADKAMECGQDRKARVQKWFAAHADKAMECGQDRKARVQKWLALDELHRVVTPPHLYAYPLLSMVETGMEKDKNQNRKQTLGIAAHADKAMECGQDRKARVQKWFAAHADKAMECGQDRKARVQKWLALDELHRVVTPPHLYAYPLLSMVETGMEKDKNQNRKQTLGIAAHADKAMECGQDRKARVQKWFAAHADKAMECGQDRKARVQKWLALDELHRVVTPPHLYAYPLLSMVETGMEKDKNQNRKQTLGIAAHADKAMECGQDRKARVQKWFAAHADKAMECGQDRKARVQKWLALDELHRVVTPPHLYAYPLLSMVETGMEKDKNQNRKQTLGIAAHADKAMGA
ncbi:hypothetical protein niasHT_033042 [Heterodera trifolii]|uniref:Uncharacterized protein n=1 Tax=Heterodera trifolii TaxID=157864 RepID=A0ABD2J0Z4_9BILA